MEKIADFELSEPTKEYEFWLKGLIEKFGDKSLKIVIEAETERKARNLFKDFIEIIRNNKIKLINPQ